MTNTYNGNGDILLEKVEFFKDIVQKTISYVNKNKKLNIIGTKDVYNCIERVGEINKKIHCIKNNIDDLNHLQIINNDLSTLFKNYGTYTLNDLFIICFGNNHTIATDEMEETKLNFLKQYFHPTSYVVITKKPEINENNLACLDISSSYKQIHMQIYGIKIVVHSLILNKSLIIYGYVDDVVIEFFNNKYMMDLKTKIMQNVPKDDKFKTDSFDKFMSSLIIPDFLINENENDIYDKYIGYISHNTSLRNRQTSQIIKDFISYDMYNKRNIIMNLVIFSSTYENQYLAYLLYDLLSNDSNGKVDSCEQILLFDSLPWPIQVFFKQSIKKTIQYTNELTNLNINKIPLEQQICLLKTSDSVKEKAMVKLKEINSKSEDSCGKARQYIDALLKIPFGIYKKEPILNMMDKIRISFKNIINKYNIHTLIPEIIYKEKYTSVEVLKYIKTIQDKIINNNALEIIRKHLIVGNKQTVLSNLKLLQNILSNHKENIVAVSSKISKDDIILHINAIMEPNKYISDIYNDIMEEFKCVEHPKEIIKEIADINNNVQQISNYMRDVKITLDKSVYGHDKVKNQINRIIGHWINGDMETASSHIIGFEGNPGIGKTTLAKGLANCLKDENGISRPFYLIALGGDSNAATLQGHGYTYVGSNFGSIVQILIDSKCMNPIILFDEVDKISRTEHGKEIVGILTHLLDTTQNKTFQDKYFSGIDLDLSKALFILSYNDVSAIDKILLDRITRIKFDSLSVDDKIIICNKHLLPELCKQIGLEDMIELTDDTIKFIIEEYTLEPGVRKLKEKLFEIIGEINLDIIQNNNDYELPIKITIDDIKHKYFKDKREIIIRQVPKNSMIGYANGMYATTLGTGGTLPIHAKFFPSEHFLELKLTGLQQDVMKESMHVSLTVAWNLTSEIKRTELRLLFDGKHNKYGINIHPGDASVQKDGPSAGGIITLVLYSLLNNIPIKANTAMTGEIQMSGEITAIGGLSYKILGSIKAGVKEFIYPNENKKDFDEFYEKYKKNYSLIGIKFYAVNNITEALDIMLEK